MAVVKIWRSVTSNKFWVPQQDITALGPIVTLDSKIFKYFTEVYRSGHNGPDSKSGIRQRIVGSNPTASAIKNEHRLVFFFLCRWDENCGSADIWRTYVDGQRSARVSLFIGCGCIPPLPPIKKNSVRDVLPQCIAFGADWIL